MILSLILSLMRQRTSFLIAPWLPVIIAEDKKPKYKSLPKYPWSKAAMLVEKADL